MAGVSATDLRSRGIAPATFQDAVRRIAAGADAREVAAHLKLTYAQQVFVTDQAVKAKEEHMAKQRKMAGMPDPIYSFEGVAYGKFRFGLGNAADIELDESSAERLREGNTIKRVHFRGSADVVTVKHNKTKRIRSDIANLNADDFRIVKIEDIEEEEVAEEEEAED